VSQAGLTVYWRPGCGYCRRLRRALGREGVSYEAIDIWQDPGARDFVRSAADGNETVPTVRLGDDVMVNPDPDDLLKLIREGSPGLIGAAPSRRFDFWRSVR
jgi:glutaredoxin-like protein